MFSIETLLSHIIGIGPFTLVVFDTDNKAWAAASLADFFML